jgi:hypothetical protein
VPTDSDAVGVTESLTVDDGDVVLDEVVLTEADEDGV